MLVYKKSTLLLVDMFKWLRKTLFFCRCMKVTLYSKINFIGEDIASLTTLRLEHDRFGQPSFQVHRWMHVFQIADKRCHHIGKLVNYTAVFQTAYLFCAMSYINCPPPHFLWLLWYFMEIKSTPN